MSSKKTKTKSLASLFKSHIIKEEQNNKDFEVDKTMFDYIIKNPDQLYNEIEETVSAIIEQDTVSNNCISATENNVNTLFEPILNSSVNSISSQNEYTNTVIDSKYIVLEKTENDILPEIISHKNDKINFYNPMQSCEQFEKEFYSDIPRFSNNLPFHAKEKDFILSKLNAKPMSDKYPGTLNIAFNTINDLSLNEWEGSGVSVVLHANGNTYKSPVHKFNKNIKLDWYVKIPINKKEPIKIKIYLQKHKQASLFFSASIETIAECIFTLDTFDSLHNKLIDMAGRWSPHYHKSTFKNIKRLFNKPNIPVGTLRLYTTYISNKDLYSVDCEEPTSLYSLNKWLMIKKHSKDLLFAGYLNISVDKSGWKKVYVKWYGFTIKIFDAMSKRMLNTLNISEAEIVCNSTCQGEILFKINKKMIKINCDSAEKLGGCIEAMSILFPKAVFERCN